ncbi:DUF6233 domain-containing protein [Streptomyces sp. NPDC002265]|uniref:DUF6233 domain-containing protein n=1 Tax=Streptomyces sp. NPDC002265 TaxID=3154415 RepID=UPI00331822EF
MPTSIVSWGSRTVNPCQGPPRRRPARRLPRRRSGCGQQGVHEGLVALQVRSPAGDDEVLAPDGGSPTRSGSGRSGSADGRPGRPPRTGSSRQRIGHGPPAYVHAGHCHMAGRQSRGVAHDTALRALVRGVPACTQCRPDSGLGCLARMSKLSPSRTEGGT